VKIIAQHHEVLRDTECASEFIERCGRVAYRSEDKITDKSSTDFVRMLVAKNHGAVLEHASMSVRFVTDRGVSHELVRHRLASYTQESTRYCNYSRDIFENQVTFIKPVWIDDERVLEGKMYANYSPEIMIWMEQMLLSESSYLRLLNLGWTAQQARAVLPNSLKTEIIVTANYREWLHIFKLRAVDRAAHPQMRALMIPLYSWCRVNKPHIFDMGEPQ
jgi:thymidylate synthase (FAD)